MRRTLRTAHFLHVNTGRKFAWGDWDCNLFIVDLLDYIDSDMPWRSQSIRGKYDTGLGAARFQYHYTPAPKWLQQQGYNLLTTEEYREHDIILEPQRRYWAASLYFAEKTWAVIEEQGLTMNVVDQGPKLVARLPHG